MIKTLAEELNATDGLDALRTRLAASGAADRALNKKLDDADLEDRIALGVARGLMLCVQDEATVKAYWRRGFQELAAHSSDASSQWIGKRLLTVAVIAIAVTCIVWLVRSGAIR